MCQAFSGLLTSDAKVFWKFGIDSHSELVRLAGYPDNTADPKQMYFAKFEITPRNGNYLAPDEWVYEVDESPVPVWCGHKHEEAAWAAHKKWLAKLNKILVPQKIVHPFDVTPSSTITKSHIRLLREWSKIKSVRGSVWDSVWDGVGGSVWDSVGDSAWDGVGGNVRDSVWGSVRDSVWGSVGGNVRDSVWGSVWDSVGAYFGSFFVLPKWKYIKHKRGVYPFASAVKLWKKGLVPSFDGMTWRLHGGPKGEILFSISAEELQKVR